MQLFHPFRAWMICWDDFPRAALPSSFHFDAAGRLPWAIIFRSNGALIC